MPDPWRWRWRWWRVRWLRGLLAATALVVLAAPAWPVQVGGTFVDAAFAFELVEHGRLSWPDGVEGEGYGGLLWVLLMVVPAALGWDPGLVMQGVALACGVALILLANARLGSAPADHLLLAGVVLLPSLAWWSGMGTETSLVALLLAVGWTATLAPGASRGIAALAFVAACLLRPECHVHALVAAVILLSRREAVAVVVEAALWLVAFHLWRVWMFGAPLPAGLPVHAEGSAGLLAAGWSTARGGLLAAPLLWLWSVRLRTPSLLWLLPFVGHLLLPLLGAEGVDDDRLLLPGLAASLAILAAVGEPRQARWLLPSAVAVGAASLGANRPTGVVWRGWPTADALRRAVTMQLDTPDGATAAWLPSQLGGVPPTEAIVRLERLVRHFPAQPRLRDELSTLQAAALLPADELSIGPRALEAAGGVVEVQDHRVALYTNGVVQLPPVPWTSAVSWVLSSDGRAPVWLRCGEGEARVVLDTQPALWGPCALGEGGHAEVHFRDDAHDLFSDLNVYVWGARRTAQP